MFVTYVRYESIWGNDETYSHQCPWGRVYFQPSENFNHWHNTLNRPSECIWIIPGTAEME